MRKSILLGAVVVCCLALSGCGLFGPGCSQNGNALVCGEARFEFLTPSLVRLEYSSTRHFVDAPSVVVKNRVWPPAKFTFARKGTWEVAVTPLLTLSYHLNSGPFTARNLQISWKENGEQRAWSPGDDDSLNLGGISASLDGISQKNFPPNSDGLLSRSGYFLLDDSRTPIWNPQTNWIEPRPNPTEQDWYFSRYGDDYRQALAAYARLTGSVPMPPRYVLGAMVTDLNFEDVPTNDLIRGHQYTAANVEKLVSQFRAAKIPLDVLVLDFGWHKFGWQGGYDWSSVFPRPADFLRWARSQGVKIALNDHPGYAGQTHTVLSSDDSHSAEIHKLLSLPSSAPVRWNLAQKRQAEAFMQALHFPLMDQGVDFWWVDGGSGAASMSGLDPRLWTNRVYYDLSEQHTGKRAFLMSRYGGWGNNRYPSFFTGDTDSDWEVLAYEIGYTARAGNVLEPYVTNDIGGFHGGDIPFDLYARWVEFGAFSPLLRLHSAYENPRDGNLRMPWTYGPQGVALVRKYFSLRYRLLPYTYTFARIAHDDALPIVRPLYLEDSSDPQSYAYPNEYFFGNEMLVAPVSDPSGVEQIYLPPGPWTDLSSGQTYQGGTLLRIQAPLGVLPVFVKGGSIIPLAPDMAYSDQKPLNDLTLAVYGPQPGSFRLYEDDGTSLGYRTGQYAWTPIAFQISGPTNWEMTIGPTTGTYRSQPGQRVYTIQLHGMSEPTAISVDGQPIYKRPSGPLSWSWDAASSVTTIRLPSRPIRSAIRIDLSTAP